MKGQKAKPLQSVSKAPEFDWISRLLFFAGGFFCGMLFVLGYQFIEHPKPDKPVQVAHVRHYVNEDGWLYTKDASGAKKQVVVCE